MDRLHADARHLPHCAAFVTRHRLSSQHLGFAFARRHRRDARVRLFATAAQNFAFSRPRSAADRISANSQLKWPTPNLSARLHTRALPFHVAGSPAPLRIVWRNRARDNWAHAAWK